MTALDDWIIQTLAGKYSDNPQNLIADASTVAAALQLIQAGLGPITGPEAANTFLAGPTSGAPANPAFRPFAAADFASTLLLSIGNLNVNSATIPANGLYLPVANTLGFTSNGAEQFVLSGINFGGIAGSGPRLSNRTAAATIPTLIPNASSSGTGIGSQAAGNFSGICNGSEIWRTQGTGFVMELGSITPLSTSGITGTTTNDNANAGSVGEFVESIVTAAAPVAYTTSGTPQDLTLIALTAGDWDVSGFVKFLPDGTTTTSQILGSFNTAPNTLPAGELTNTLQITLAAGSVGSIAVPRRRFSLAAGANVSLVADAVFAVSTMSMCGFINARRVR